MKILVFSDSHGNTERMISAIADHLPAVDLQSLHVEGEKLAVEVDVLEDDILDASAIHALHRHTAGRKRREIDAVDRHAAHRVCRRTVRMGEPGTPSPALADVREVARRRPATAAREANAPHRAVARRPEFEVIAVRPRDDIRDQDVLHRVARIVRLDADGVIPAVDLAVGDHDPLRLDVDAVVVRVRVGVDPHAADLNVLRLLQDNAPARGVPEREVGEAHAAAVPEDESARTQPLPSVFDWLRERPAASVDSPLPGHGDVRGPVGRDDRAPLALRVRQLADGVVGEIGRAEKEGARLEMKLDVAPELELKNANGEVKGWTAAKTNDPKDEVFTVKFYDKKKAEITDAAKYASAVYVEVSTDDITKFYDNATYTQTLLTYNDKNGLVQKITANITKVMPTEAELVEFRPKQETEDGSGIFKAYMIPFFDKDAADLAGQQAQYKVADEPAAVGTKDLNNVFYGLDSTYVFTVADAVYNEKTKKFDQPLVIAYTDNSVTGLTYDMTVATDLIDNKTQHAITVEVNYGAISTTKDKDGEPVVKEYKVKADQTLQVIFACWHDAEKYVWKTDVDSKTGKVTKDYTPAPQWTTEAAGDEAEFSAILATSSYNNDFFGDMSVADIMELGWLILAVDEEGEEIAPELVYEPKKQVNPYFIPSIDGDKVIFEQISTQVDAAPVADHKETLKIYVQDAFGHQTAISTEITVKKPNTK